METKKNRVLFCSPPLLLAVLILPSVAMVPMGCTRGRPTVGEKASSLSAQHSQSIRVNALLEMIEDARLPNLGQTNTFDPSTPLAKHSTPAKAHFISFHNDEPLADREAIVASLSRCVAGPVETLPPRDRPPESEPMESYSAYVNDLGSRGAVVIGWVIRRDCSIEYEFRFVRVGDRWGIRSIAAIGIAE